MAAGTASFDPYVTIKKCFEDLPKWTDYDEKRTKDYEIEYSECHDKYQNVIIQHSIFLTVLQRI